MNPKEKTSLVYNIVTRRKKNGNNKDIVKDEETGEKGVDEEKLNLMNGHYSQLLIIMILFVHLTITLSIVTDRILSA